MSNIISFEDWQQNHELLYGIGILGNGYLIVTAQNAMEELGIKKTRDAIAQYQIDNNLINEFTHNIGVIDVPTFLSLIEVFKDDPEVYNEIIMIMEEYTVPFLEAMVEEPRKRPNILQKIASFVKKKLTLK